MKGDRNESEIYGEKGDKFLIYWKDNRRPLPVRSVDLTTCVPQELGLLQDHSGFHSMKLTLVFNLNVPVSTLLILKIPKMYHLVCLLDLSKITEFRNETNTSFLVHVSIKKCLNLKLFL